jgi:hypothetical protein
MRSNPFQPKVHWKTVAVTGDDPHSFAHALEAALQEMTDNQFQVVSQTVRGAAIIITGQRVDTPLGMQEQVAAQTQPPLSRIPARRAVVEQVPKGVMHEEVLYHCIEQGEQVQKVFPSLVDALRLVSDHLRVSPPSGVDPIIPVGLTILNTTTFDITAFPYLLRGFADKLRTPTPLE